MVKKNLEYNKNCIKFQILTMKLCNFTGDPRQDIEYERQYHQTQSTFIVPNDIKNFLTFFRKCVNELNVYEIQNMYEIE